MMPTLHTDRLTLTVLSARHSDALFLPERLIN